MYGILPDSLGTPLISLWGEHASHPEKGKPYPRFS